MSFLFRAGASLCLLFLVVRPAGAAPVFINEFHYDNTGADSSEFIELAGSAGTLLDGWSLTLYNGSNGGVYDTISLAGQLADDTGTGFGFLMVDIPGLQNGSPDGIALADASDNLIEFISYEGSFTAVGGVAGGIGSADVGVSELSSTPFGWSLQLTGTGSTAGDFTWATPQSATRGASNTGQTFLTVGAFNPLPLPPVLLLMFAGLAGLAMRSARMS